MLFLKIKDPIKGDLIVEEFLKTKKNIQEKFITERLGDIKESLVSELRPIEECLKELPAVYCGTSRRRRRERRSDASGKRLLTNTSATTLPNKTSTRLLEYKRIRWTNCTSTIRRREQI